MRRAGNERAFPQLVDLVALTRARTLRRGRPLRGHSMVGTRAPAAAVGVDAACIRLFSQHGDGSAASGRQKCGQPA